VITAVRVVDELKGEEPLKSSGTRDDQKKNQEGRMMQNPWADEDRARKAVNACLDVVRTAVTTDSSDDSHPVVHQSEHIGYLMRNLADYAVHAAKEQRGSAMTAAHRTAQVLAELCRAGVSEDEVFAIAADIFHGMFSSSSMVSKHLRSVRNYMDRDDPLSGAPVYTTKLSPLSAVLLERIQVPDHEVLHHLEDLYCLFTHTKDYNHLWSGITPAPPEHYGLTQVLVDALRDGALSTREALVMHHVLWSHEYNTKVRSLSGPQGSAFLDYLGTAKQSTRHRAMRLVAHIVGTSGKDVDLEELMAMLSAPQTDEYSLELMSSLVSVPSKRVFKDDPEDPSSPLYALHRISLVLS
jgi:hypothetical protein